MPPGAELVEEGRGRVIYGAGDDDAVVWGAFLPTGVAVAATAPNPFEPGALRRQLFKSFSRPGRQGAHVLDRSHPARSGRRASPSGSRFRYRFREHSARVPVWLPQSSG